MLQRLSIKNYALIDRLEMNFSGKMNIITGETGAGKSIILGGLSLMLGQRAESKSLFDPTQKCVVEGTFNMPEKRVFDVEINEIKKLANFDIFEKTRTKNLAHIESFYLKPNAKGEFNIRFISEIGDACVNGIEIGN